jgi:A/G-specific adenine glycosylase
MLQQTQVATVVPYYARFLDRFPDAASLARATEDDVLSAWSGLGYYGRARSLRQGARAVVERYGGRLPRDAAALRGLPGIGRSTAGAIASIAFDQPEPVLDGNVRRVLSRLVATGTGRQQALWELAARLVDGPDPGAWNQALMELGAVVCTPRNPRCPECPLARSCRARALGRPESFPEPRRGTPGHAERVRVAVALVRRAGRVLLERPPGASPLRGTWDIPAIEIGAAGDAAREITRGLGPRLGLKLRPIGLVARASHAILRRTLSLEIYECRLSEGRVAGRQDVRWVSPSEELCRTPVSGATHKALRLAAAPPSEASR